MSIFCYDLVTVGTVTKTLLKPAGCCGSVRKPMRGRRGAGNQTHTVKWSKSARGAMTPTTLTGDTSETFHPAI